MKAIVNRETAERMLADEELQTNLTQLINQTRRDIAKNPEIVELQNNV